MGNEGNLLKLKILEKYINRFLIDQFHVFFPPLLMADDCIPSDSIELR